MPTKQDATQNPQPIQSDEERQARKEKIEKRYQGLLEISNLVGSVMELDDILARICTITCQIFQAPVCSTYLLDAEGNRLVLRAAQGLGPQTAEYIGLAALPLGRGLPGIAAQNNELISVPDAVEDPRHETVHGADTNQHHAYICCPLRQQEEVIGVLTARRDTAEPFTQHETMIFETVSKQVAIVLEKSDMYFQKIEADRLAAISISLSEVAHYIKNVLQGMKGGIYFVDMGLKRGDLDMTRKGWEVLRRGNKKTAQLVENMLAFSRESELKLENHNINSIIFDILHQIDDSAIERGVALLPTTQRDLPPIPLDYDRIYDALLNLIANAIDAIPADNSDGLVQVCSRLSEDRRYVEVKVIDSGTGIPDDVKKKIWNLFFSTKGERGSGIGLATTRKIIEQHKGQIEVESEEGKGATFTLRLPIQPENGITQEAS